MPKYPWGACAAGCGAEPRPLSEITADFEEIPARELRHAQLTVMRQPALEPARAFRLADSTARALISARISRIQLELAGHCPHCALRGQLKALETGPLSRGADHA